MRRPHQPPRQLRGIWLPGASGIELAVANNATASQPPAAQHAHCMHADSCCSASPEVTSPSWVTLAIGTGSSSDGDGLGTAIEPGLGTLGSTCPTTPTNVHVCVRCMCMRCCCRLLQPASKHHGAAAAPAASPCNHARVHRGGGGAARRRQPPTRAGCRSDAASALSHA